MPRDVEIRSTQPSRAGKPTVPNDIGDTLARIARGEMDPHRNDGRVFENRPDPSTGVRPLPVQVIPDYYREYVHPTPGGRPPGPQRVVIGLGGEIYYTPDHYHTFVPVITPQGP
ncbi:MAG: ribonuclease domain-containing protein [Opitutaceae bacterium]